MSYRLYSNAHNSAGERVRIGFALKGVDYEYISIKSLGWDAYQSINPQGLLPTLEVGGERLTQSTAILEYLEERHPDPSLLPADALLRGKSRALGQVIASEMHAIDVGRVRRFLEEALGVSKEGTVQWSEHWMAQGFDTVEALLAQRPLRYSYCFGETPGWADLFLVPEVRKRVSRFDFDLAPYPLIGEIYATCTAHPAFMAASPELQSDFDGPLSRQWHR